MQLAAWRKHEKRIAAYQVADGAPLLERIPEAELAALSDLEVLVLRYAPDAYLRPPQIVPRSGDWLVNVFMCGRGWGKSHAAAAWIVERVLEGSPDAPSDYVLVAPTEDDCWDLQWATIKKLLPPWVRHVERKARKCVLFPDYGVTLYVHSAEVTEYRGPNLRGAWLEEPVKWPNGKKLWGTLRPALRVRGTEPPRAVMTTTPPQTLDWILDLCAEATTRVVRGTMRDNPCLDDRAVEATYCAGAGTVEARRELDGEVVIGTDGALFKQEELDAYRCTRADVPKLERVVISVDPAQSAKKDADPVGITAVGYARGHVFVLASCSERLDPAAWAERAIRWADEYDAGQYVVEYTGSGSYPRATLEAQMRILDVTFRPILDSKARGSKADRAMPLSAAAKKGRVHIVGVQTELERELTSWFPGAGFSPGGLDALVHGSATVTNNWKAMV